MRRAAAVALVAAAGALGAAAGFWAGFAEGWDVGVESGYLPRGALAAQHLAALRAGKTQSVFIGLEFEVDSGLIWGDALFQHPMRELWGPLWGLPVYPGYEQYATRLADYRKQHPSLLRTEAFDAVPRGEELNREIYGDLSRTSRQTSETIGRMVRRYASKP